jgi:hypothetical protein
VTYPSPRADPGTGGATRTKLRALTRDSERIPEERAEERGEFRQPKKHHHATADGK